ncbi:MAG TPA: SAM-dependent methyltransferase [Opitutaceae bacterium]|nr:SAM-dependent methyltransferase [Opitutaceae bacterium]
MQPGKPSQTALGAASHRAAHQKLEHGFIFRDPLAERILGEHLEEAIRKAEENPRRRGLRLFIAARTRFAEDALDAAVASGVLQLVVLGAGLDTYAYRTRHAALRIFEIDHPATQAWKREQLAKASIPVPANLTFAPVDFERETIEQGLAAAGFDPQRPAFFTWLGVVPYLSEPAIFATLDHIARLPGGAHVVFDYGNPPEAGKPDPYAAAREELARRVALIGEELKTQFETGELHARLSLIGFREIDDIGPRQMRERYIPNRPGEPAERGGHVVRASTLPLSG